MSAELLFELVKRVGHLQERLDQLEYSFAWSSAEEPRDGREAVDLLSAVARFKRVDPGALTLADLRKIKIEDIIDPVYDPAPIESRPRVSELFERALGRIKPFVDPPPEGRRRPSPDPWRGLDLVEAVARVRGVPKETVKLDDIRSIKLLDLVPERPQRPRWIYDPAPEDLIRRRFREVLEDLVAERAKPQPDPWKERLTPDSLARMNEADLERTLHELETERAHVETATKLVRERLSAQKDGQ